jgi:hypothetical protein
MKRFFQSLLIIITVAFGGANLPCFGLTTPDASGYREENVLFYNADSTMHFGGTLTIPCNKKKIPIVIIVSGTGQQDRNGTMAGHKLFSDIADFLSQRGIAVLRTDDRGVGETNGDYSLSTTADFASDALTAVNYLKSRKDLPLEKIGLMGHSEGGAAITIAASQSKEIDFLVSIAGLATDGLSSLIRQNEDIVAATNIPDYNKKRYNDINRIMFQTAYDYAQSDSLEAKLNERYEAWKVKDDEYFKSLNVGEFDHFHYSIYMYTMQATSPWYRFFIRYNPQPYMNKITIPVLAINGNKDIMVAYDQNLKHFEEYLINSPKVTTKIFPGLNHLFLPCEKGTPDEYASIQESFSKEALQFIYDWIMNL